jgi:3'(2'), 5'-bisphosphate nucleotidase
MEYYLNSVIEIAKQAGREILQIYIRDGDLKFELKADDSPLTEADLVAHNIIKKGLTNLAPDIPILSEEEADIPYEERSRWQTYWLVDPLDGTNEFLSHSGQFTVNIALIKNHEPVLGISYAPVPKLCYFACRGKGAFREDEFGKVVNLKTKEATKGQIKVIVSKEIGIEKLQTFLAHLNKHELIYFGGSLKLCLVAECAVDIYPRLGLNCEWDTAAGQCIVEEAGGMVVDLNFKPLRYNTGESLYNPYFLVLADPSYNWQEYLRFLK